MKTARVLAAFIVLATPLWSQTSAATPTQNLVYYGVPVVTVQATKDFVEISYADDTLEHLSWSRVKAVLLTASAAPNAPACIGQIETIRSMKGQAVIFFNDGTRVCMPLVPFEAMMEYHKAKQPK
jgi:hypothetical protein